tara:strand:+ start:234 stop:698 length:465 start_codon:yes stop_codon:yes gene_type:complete
MSKHTISGKFFINGKKHYYTSQQDLADGWRNVLPSSNFVETSTEEFKDITGKTVKKKKFRNEEIYNEVTLAQLPPYLFSRVKNCQTNDNIVMDNFFKFRIIRTLQDDLIQELYKLVIIKYPSSSDKTKMKELVEVLELNDISGWLIIRAKNIAC